jgi:hypothetical protein
MSLLYLFRASAKAFSKNFSVLGPRGLSRPPYASFAGKPAQIVLTADAGNFALTGSGANFLVDEPADVASYSISGAGSFAVGLPGAAGSFSLSGNASFAVVMPAVAASLVITGTANFSSSGSRAGLFSVLGPLGISRPPYGSFAGKQPTVSAETGQPSVSAGSGGLNRRRLRWREPIAVLEQIRFGVDPGSFDIAVGNALLSCQASVDDESLAAAAIAQAAKEQAERKRRVIENGNDWMMAA